MKMMRIHIWIFVATAILIAMLLYPNLFYMKAVWAVLCGSTLIAGKPTQSDLSAPSNKVRYSDVVPTPIVFGTILFFVGFTIFLVVKSVYRIPDLFSSDFLYAKQLRWSVLGIVMAFLIVAYFHRLNHEKRVLEANTKGPLPSLHEGSK